MSAVLVLNAGSSTIKYRLVGVNHVLGSGIVERIGEDGARMLQRRADGSERSVERPVADHEAGLRLLFDELDHPAGGPARLPDPPLRGSTASPTATSRGGPPSTSDVRRPTCGWSPCASATARARRPSQVDGRSTRRWG